MKRLILVLITLISAQAFAKPSLDEAIEKVRARYAVSGKRETLKAKQKAEREELKAKHKAEREALKVLK